MIEGHPMGFVTQNQLKKVYYSNKKLENINCVLARSHDEAGLYIGDAISTLKRDYLIDNQIQAILRCNKQASNHIAQTDFPIQLIMMDIGDSPQYPVRLHFQSAYNFIEEMRTKNHKNILVQCHGGLSRSATIVCAYLMRKKKWSADQALSYLRIRRPRVKPNEGFINQLRQYEKELQPEKFREKEEKKEVNLQFETPKKQAKDLPIQLGVQSQIKQFRSSQKLNLGHFFSPQKSFHPVQSHQHFLSPRHRPNPEDDRQKFFPNKTILHSPQSQMVMMPLRNEIRPPSSQQFHRMRYVN